MVETRTPPADARRLLTRAGIGLAIIAGLADAPPPASAQTAPTGTSNFLIGTAKDASGRIPVTADWTTPLGVGIGDLFQSNGAPAAVTIGPDANLYTITNVSKGASTTPNMITLAPGSVFTNHGVLNNYPETYPSFAIDGSYNHTGWVVAGDNDTVLNNYGTIGFITQNQEDTWGAIEVNGKSGVVINNYGLLAGDTPVVASGTSGVRVNNYAGAKMIASFGSPVLGATTYNYRNAGMIDLKTNGSYCTHTGGNVSVFNWGYCIAAANGFWLDQGVGQAGYDYGGPLVPSSIDFSGNVVFNGTLSTNFFEAVTDTPCTSPLGGGNFLGPVFIVGKVTMTLANTVYTIRGQPGQIVNYLPLTYGYPMTSVPWNGSGQRVGPLSSVLNFRFSGLTAAQQAMIQTAVDSGSASTAGSFALDGQTYSWCPFGRVTATFSDTIVGSGINGFPIPGVYYYEGGRATYYSDADDLATNPYYLVNAATVRLTKGQTLQPGQTVIQPGWTLVVGASLINVVNKALTYPQLDDDFSTSPNPEDSIELQTARASTPGNVDGVLGQTATLSAALVINNPSQTVTLPNLTGGGSLMQEGSAITTLVGSANTITGPIYLGNGTLRLATGAAFSVPPALIVGTNDQRAVSPTFDISAFGTAKTFTLSSLTTAGPQIQVIAGTGGSGLFYPTIQLGGTTLMVGTGKRKDRSTFLGGLVGTGGLVVASQTTLDLGGIAGMNVLGNPAKTVPISTFSGGTTVVQGGTLILENPNALGAGSLTNAGTVQLGSGSRYLPATHGVSEPSADAAPNHVVTVPAAYTQTPTGALVLRVKGDDGTGAAGSGAGAAYEQLIAAGRVSLAGTLTLTLLDGYVPPAGGATLSVVSAPAGLTGQFTTVQVVGGAAKVAAQHVTSNGVTVTLMPAGG